MSKLESIGLELIKENPIALRQVDKQSERYLGLVDSIRKTAEDNDGVGILNAISVKPLEDGTFMLIDGLHRVTASRDAGMEEIPAQIIDMDDAQIKVAQIMANVHKIETKPVQYSRQLHDIMGLNPTMSLSDMAAKLAQSVTWVSQRLGLLKLEEGVGYLVDEGKIKLSNAYELAKLPIDDQLNYLEDAQTMSPQEFSEVCKNRAKEIRDANRKGQDAEEAVFEPSAHCQKVGALKEEMETGEVGKELTKGLKKAEDGFAMAIKWVLHLDPESMKIAQENWEVKKKARDESKAKREQERKAKKADEAAKRAEEARKAAEEAKAAIG